MKTKTSELEGAALDWAVAKSVGKRVAVDRFPGEGKYRCLTDTPGGVYEPSSSWGQGGPLLESHDVALNAGAKDTVRGIFATARRDNADGPHGCGFGPTRLIAAMRAIVASELGDEVDVPKELVS